MLQTNLYREKLSVAISNSAISAATSYISENFRLQHNMPHTHSLTSTLSDSLGEALDSCANTDSASSKTVCKSSVQRFSWGAIKTWSQLS